MTVGAVRAALAAGPRAASPTEALAALTVVAGCIALVSRPVSPAFAAITIVVGLAGALHPLAIERTSGPNARLWCATVALGVGAFAIARGALGGSLIPPPGAVLLGSAIVAAVAEEAFFRRFVYATLLRWGVPFALAGSSFGFAIVHVTFWGWRAVPVDLAAGSLLGWQRWATGSWTAPAVTHAAANVLMLL
ncbi:MAG: CPBP family glutamic-type intramembrane protease [Actinomycetota bacterium]